ncbi:MAG: DUF935 family protein [Verrucomicrobia bacterium]|nr:DUF935 family protein [Verrucomicrobiota bacterium]
MQEPLHIRNLNRARDWYNPLRGLNVQRVVALLEEGERGKYDALQKLNRMAEKRHPTLRALKHRRLAALKKLDWDVKVPSELPAGITAAQAAAQQRTLRTAYEAIGNLPEVFEWLALPTFRGFSHLEPRHLDDDPAAPIVRLNPVPQWHWGRNPDNFDEWLYDAEARGSLTSAVPVDPAGFIIREVDDPLYEIALLCFLRRNLAKKNWTVFQEDYALASIFAMLGENTPLDKVKEWLELVKGVTGNSRGALPPGAKIEALDLGNLDGVQFENFIKAEDADLVLAGTSGLLTMLTAAGGLGNEAQGQNHQEAFDTLALAESMDISAVLQTQFDRRILAAEYPSQKPVAYFQLAAQDVEDLDALAERLVKLRNAGFTALADELSEKFGLTLEAAAGQGPAPAGAGAPGGGDQGGSAGGSPPSVETALKNRETPAQRPASVAAGLAAGLPAEASAKAGREARFMAAAEAALAEADRAVMAPLIHRVAPIRAELVRLAGLDEKDDATFAAGLEALQPRLIALQADIPALERQVLTGRPDLEDAFTDIVGTAFVSGVVQAGEARQAALKEAKP